MSPGNDVGLKCDVLAGGDDDDAKFYEPLLLPQQMSRICQTARNAMKENTMFEPESDGSGESDSGWATNEEELKNEELKVEEAERRRRMASLRPSERALARQNRPKTHRVVLEQLKEKIDSLNQN